MFKDWKDAFAWSLERHPHISGLLKLSSIAGGRKVFLMSHGNSRSGAVKDLGPNCLACLVHTTDDDNVVWTETTVNVHGRESKILSKTALTTPGFVLAAASYPRRLSPEGQSNEWWPLPGLTSNVIIKPIAGVWKDVNMTTVWHVLPDEDPAAADAMVAEDPTMFGA